MTWTHVLESSRAVRLIRRAVSRRIVAVEPSRLAGRMPILPATSFADDRALVVFENSAIVHALVRLVAGADRFARHSRTARIVWNLREAISASPLETRIRQAAVVLFSAIVVHLLMTRFNAPEPTVLARVIWTGIAVLLVAVIAGARGVAVAWVEWLSRRRAAHISERE